MDITLPVWVPPPTPPPKPEHFRTLTVRELITKLQAFDPHTPVLSDNAWVVDVTPEQGYGDTRDVAEQCVNLKRVL
jgi:hypothetical protein